jgi:hypothetical protein
MKNFIFLCYFLLKFFNVNKYCDVSQNIKGFSQPKGGDK